jgi:ATP-dependent Clp protease ATP-binding subunit ClpA
MIVGKTINEINDMLKDKNIKIKLLVKAKRWLRDKGYQPDMGARPLQRVVNDYIKKPLSKEILFGKLVNGGTVTIDIKDDEVKFEYS